MVFERSTKSRAILFPTVQTTLEPLRHVVATRYVLPLREGGSLPGLLEADDLGTYVVKFRGAGQGTKALAAEIIVAALARAAGFRVPELVLVELDPELARAEPDQEVQDLLRASAGLNLGVDFLPRSFGFDPVADRVDAQVAAGIVWFDALVHNVDRSWRNPNMLCWHGDLWLIDHGAALYFAHSWPTADGFAIKPYAQINDHVLLRLAGSITTAAEDLSARLSEDVVRRAAADIPDDWLAPEPGFSSADDIREAYVRVLTERLARQDAWVPLLEDARASV